MKLETTSDNDCEGCGGRGCVPNKSARWWEVWKPASEVCSCCEGSGESQRRLYVLASIDGGELYLYGEADSLDAARSIVRAIFAAELRVSFLGERQSRSVNVRCEIRKMRPDHAALIPRAPLRFARRQA